MQYEDYQSLLQKQVGYHNMLAIFIKKNIIVPRGDNVLAEITESLLAESEYF
jgi:hypothetical protein